MILCIPTKRAPGFRKNTYSFLCFCLNSDINSDAILKSGCLWQYGDYCKLKSLLYTASPGVKMWLLERKKRYFRNIRMFLVKFTFYQRMLDFYLTNLCFIFSKIITITLLFLIWCCCTWHNNLRRTRLDKTRTSCYKWPYWYKHTPPSQSTLGQLTYYSPS